MGNRHARTALGVGESRARAATGAYGNRAERDCQGCGTPLARGPVDDVGRGAAGDRGSRITHIGEAPS